MPAAEARRNLLGDRQESSLGRMTGMTGVTGVTGMTGASGRVVGGSVCGHVVTSLEFCLRELWEQVLEHRPLARRKGDRTELLGQELHEHLVAISSMMQVRWVPWPALPLALLAG